MTVGTGPARVAVDIGGTFTDVAVEHGEALHTVKVLTTPSAPETRVMQGIAAALEPAGLSPAQVGLAIPCTTLATTLPIAPNGPTTPLTSPEDVRPSGESTHTTPHENS